METSSDILITEPSQGYELIDSGDGEKLERFGQVVVRRPDPQVLWRKIQPELWEDASAFFTTQWKINKDIPESWDVSFGDSIFRLKLGTFKHVGVFPEQEQNWKWITETLRSAGKPTSVLNLFGYSGGATLAALHGGAEVCHVDGSKTAIASARQNAELSGVADRSVRWILDDALLFAGREVKRGRKYSGIVVDPPAFGRGPEGEVWKIEESLLSLIELFPSLLEEKPLFVLLNGYAAGYSKVAYQNALLPLIKHFGGKVVSGEVAIRESAAGRLLPAGIFARFTV